MVARDADGVFHIESLIIVPTRLHQRLLHCPCCRRPFLFTEQSDGSLTLAPISDEIEDGDGW